MKILRLNALVFLFITLWNDEVFDNGNAIKQRNFQNNDAIA